MAGSPVLLRAFVPLFTTVHAGTFAEPEIQTVLLTNAVTNKSRWPVALHSLLAKKAGVAASDVQAMRDGKLPAERKLAALSALARNLIETRGLVDPELVDELLHAGYRRDQALEIITIRAASTITNFVSGVAKQPLDPQIAEEAWQPAT